jgi:hypothetical protein
MFGISAWRRYRTARAKAAGERTIRKLRGRAAIREAENIVEATWVQELGRAEDIDPRLPRLLRRERSAFAAAARRRRIEAEADQRLLAAIKAEIAEMTRPVPPIG